MPLTLKITWPVVLTVTPLLAGAAAGFIYLTLSINKAHIEALENEIKTYEKSEKWKLPDTLSQLNKASEKLSSQLETQENISRIKIENLALTTKQRELETALSTASEERNRLQDKVDLLSKELRASLLKPFSFQLTEGDSMELVKSRVNLGLSSVFTSSVSSNLNNEPIRLVIGGSTKVNYMNNSCTLTLKKVASPLASFTFYCDETNEKT
ncbi:putative nuclease with TOPRIM domain [Pseudomonas hunanensis]|uniref:Nuclease with TOPRIM domain n=1 Tax=Pseudomonas hunanensis TaxID=1247546 RepID=A0ACC6K535_9PSED|nr:hypothetical protein [Pseudomonas hunanensis]MDR6713497.1 putative nuclease with TOPRIM domain [Pseudomonas hunanensis]